MISQTVEYALRAMVYLASHPGEALTAATIAEHADVPPQYMAKVLRGLGKAGLLTARRGVNGGTALARPAEQITVLDVVNAVEPLRRIVGCPQKNSKLNLCMLHRHLDDALGLMERAFQSCTIRDLLPQEVPPRTCPFPLTRRLRRAG